MDLGFGDLGFGDLGFGDLGFGDLGAPRGDLDFETAKSIGNAPNALTATLGKATLGKKSVVLNWQPPHVGSVTQYMVYRATGTIPPANPVYINTVAPPATTFTDWTVKNNTTYSYLVTATFEAATKSGPSNIVEILVK